MKAGLQLGHTYEYELRVNEADEARLIGGPVHPLYGTAAMIAHMEWAARQHILQFLEAGEEGVGYHVDVKHLVPAPLGATVRIRSEVTGIAPRRVTSRVEAWHAARKIGEGTLIQAIVPREKLYACTKEPAQALSGVTGSFSSKIVRTLEDTLDGENADRQEHGATHETQDDLPSAPPPAVLQALTSRTEANCSQRNPEPAFSLEVLKWETGLFPCTRYDEWLICRAALIPAETTAADSVTTDVSLEKRQTCEGPFLLRHEIEEMLIRPLRELLSGQRSMVSTEFLEPVLHLEITTGEPGEYTVAIRLAPPDAEPAALKFLTDHQQLSRFANLLKDQMAGFPSKL